MNLHLYIPPHSGHPPGILKSLIYGLLQKYKRQNTSEKDFNDITLKFFRRLTARGHDPSDLNPIFTKVLHLLNTNNADSPPKRNKNLTTSSLTDQADDTNQKLNHLSLKITYRPTDVSRRSIRQAYFNSCEKKDNNNNNGFRNFKKRNGEIMSIDKFTVAYRRDKNLRDILIPSSLRHSTSIEEELNLNEQP